MSVATYFPLPSRGVLAIDGPEAKDFLQNLISQDMNKVSATQASFGALLTPQGKFLFDFFIVQQGSGYLLDLRAEEIPALKKKLTLYKLRTKVTIEDASDTFSVFAAAGDGMTDALGLSGDAGQAVAFNDIGIAYTDPRYGGAGARLILAADDGVEPLVAAGLTAADEAAYDAHRIACGLPEGGVDLIKEKAFLVESGYDDLNGIDFDKGCYVGQELTTRTKRRGLVRKRLLRVDIEGEAPEAGASLTYQGKAAGEMRSSHGSSGIALLRIAQTRAALEAGAPFEAENGAKLTPVLSDWVELPVVEEEGG